MTFRRYSSALTTLFLRRRYSFLSASTKTFRQRSLSTSAANVRIREKETKNGGWTLLAALEKAKEADGIKVAQLLSSLEMLVPRTRTKDDDNNIPHPWTTSQHPNTPTISTISSMTMRPLPSTDPAFFSLPNLLNNDISRNKNKYDNITITNKDVAAMIQATRRGRRIDIYTIEIILQAATSYIQNTVTSAIVSLPPLRVLPSNNNRQQNEQQLTVIGDLHGSLSDLEAVLGLTGEPSQNNKLVFNGDFADRGDHGIEVIVVLCALVLAFPDQVILHRGNHEDITMSMMYGLAEEIQHKYGTTTFPNQFSILLDDFFKSLPLATVIENDAIIVHGGPPPPGITLDDIRYHQMPERRDVDNNFQSSNNLKSSWWRGLSRTVRSSMGTNKSLEIDGERSSSNFGDEEVVEALLWSDPDINEASRSLQNYNDGNIEYDINILGGWKPNVSRGAGYKFDAITVRNFLQAEGLHRMIRSHEPVHSGCEHHVVHHDLGHTGNKHRRNRTPIMEFFTVFSASRYPAKEGFNRGAVLKLKPNQKHDIVRYSTEDDEPTSTFKVEYQTSPIEDQQQYGDEVDLVYLRRALVEVVATRRSALKLALEEEASCSSGGSSVGDICMYDMPFNQAVDTLVRTLRLEGEGLSQPGPRLALAKTLLFKEGEQCSTDTLPDTIRLLPALDACAVAEYDNDNHGYNNCSLLQRGWLKAVFNLIDSNHDGVVSKSEWIEAVNTINGKLSEKSYDGTIDAEDTWKLLDINEDGYISNSEWNIFGKEICR